MNSWMNHLPILPVVIPMVVGALMLALRDQYRTAGVVVGVISVLAQFCVAVALFGMTTGRIPNDYENHILVYLLGNWRAPFGIVLVADQLSAIMLMLTAVLGLCSLLYSTALWDRAGVFFHPLFQFILMGLNGAFLTGDLFNLFVFFEIFLAASYGLALHGSGMARVAAGLHYVTVNLIASLLLLIAISVLYGITGTLNMADLGLRAATLAGDDRRLFEAACAILGVAFLIKAGAWPLNFWLTSAYSAAVAPVAALFAIMSKVGIYALLRIGSLLLPTGAPAAFSGDWMYVIGLATLLFGTLGILSEKNSGRLVGYCIIMSSGTLLTALGMPSVILTGPSLFYMLSSVLVTSTFFYLIELIKRTETFGGNVLAISLEAFSAEDQDKSDYSGTVVGKPIPFALAFLGLAFFICALVIAGMPPFSGFIAKFALLSKALDLSETDAASTTSVWLFVIAMLISGMATVIALGRAGIRMFWSDEQLKPPVLSRREAFPITLLLLLCIGLTVFAGPVMDQLSLTARQLDDPGAYMKAVLNTRPAFALPHGGAQ